MTSLLKTAGAVALYEQIKRQAKDVLATFNEGRFAEGAEQIPNVREIVTKARDAGTEAEEDYLNDLFVLDRYVDFRVLSVRLRNSVGAWKFGPPYADAAPASSIVTRS